MRTIFLTLILSLSMTVAFGQTEKKAYKTVADKFVTYYNNDNYDAIFAMFSPEMKKMLPADQNREFLQGLKTQKGKIIKREFKKYLRTYAMYKTNFEKEVLALKISIDSDAKINGLLVNPYGD
jgi:hypothetical protein